MLRRERVFGVLVVRDEVDVIRVCVLHHLALGCERILVVDNGSTDGTTSVLERLAQRVPLSWTSDPGDYRQSEFVSGLAHDARRARARWVLPLDADEFWIARPGLDATLAREPGVGAVHADRVEFIQRRAQSPRTPRDLLTMTMRVPAPATEDEAAIEGFRARTRSMFEIRPTGKLAFRTSGRLEIHPGGHGGERLVGRVGESVGDLTILHAPFRSRACLEQKAVHGARLERTDADPRHGWQVRHMAASARAARLDEDWRAHSYAPDGTLDVGGRQVPLVRDTRLAATLARWVRPPLVQLAARALRRSY